MHSRILLPLSVYLWIQSCRDLAKLIAEALLEQALSHQLIADVGGYKEELSNGDLYRPAEHLRIAFAHPSSQLSQIFAKIEEVLNSHRSSSDLEKIRLLFEKVKKGPF